ncbi:BMP family lipoprotein [Herbiconiux liukaitaii]|uniref:BMP family lipoprotein n=1 Tax=Herbiconiux liukaitaii TaxID=3342799 RepID=UPI0035B80538
MVTRRTTLTSSSALAFILSVGLLAAGCAGQAPSGAEAPSGAAETEGAATIGLFVTNAFGDHSYFDAAAGAIEPLEEGGATVTTYEAKLDQQSFAPLLQDAADANELVFVVGQEAIDATSQVASENPDTIFVFVNGVVPSDDVVSVAFRNAEGCYMGGAVAATVNAQAQRDTIGFIGGFNAPIVLDCEAGFKQGATDLTPSLSLVSQFVGSFNDPNKGFEVASAVAQQGAYAVYSFAGLSGQGAVKAAESGVDILPILADYPSLGAKVPATINNHTEVLLLDTAEQFSTGELEKGTSHFYGFAEGAYDVTYNDDLLTADEQASLEAIRAQIEDGTITPKGAGS